MTDIADPPKVEFIDSPFAPEFFASGVSGFFVHSGHINITFESARVNHITSPGPINRVVVLRIAMPAACAQDLAASLYDFLKKHGYDPVPVPQKDKLQ